MSSTPQNQEVNSSNSTKTPNNVNGNQVVYSSAVKYAAIGTGGFIALCTGASMLVPVAMSYCGSVVAGVGTIHASAAAGGIAATLQSVAASGTLFGVAKIATASAGIGAIAGALTRPKSNEVPNGSSADKVQIHPNNIESRL